MGSPKPIFQSHHSGSLPGSDTPPRDVAPDSDIVRITLFASAIIVVAILIVGYVSYTITKNATLNKLRSQDLVNIAELVSSRVDGRIERAKEAALILATDPQLTAWVAAGGPDGRAKTFALEKIHTLASDFDYTNSFIVSRVSRRYWDENGHLLDTVSKDDPADAWFFETLASHKAVSVHFDYNRERRDTFVFINALIGDTRHPIGVAGVGLGLKGLSQYIKTFKRGTDSHLWLVDRQGRVYLSDDASNNGESLARLLPDQTRQEVLTSMTSDVDHHRTIAYTNGDRQLMDLIVYPLSSTEWYLLFEIPRQESIAFLNTIKVQNAVATLIVLIAITFFFYYTSNKFVNPYIKAQRLNQELEEQVESRTAEAYEKNAKLMDGIRYAQRIQTSILPTNDRLNELLDEYFLIWQPRDTVGGDFYWAKKVPTGTLIAVGDCTGHGVPGALMSMISVSLLNQIVSAGQHRPAAILSELNALIKEMLGQEADGNSITEDGLDIGVCFLDQEGHLHYAGAKTALYVRDRRGLRTLSGDRVSVGYSRTEPDYPFTQEKLLFRPGQTFYITTDGYTDQNGGPHNRSFGKNQLLNLIESEHEKPLANQRETFVRALREFMGDEPQRDDITLLAFRAG